MLSRFRWALPFFHRLFVFHKIVNFLYGALVDKGPIWDPYYILTFYVENLVLVETLIKFMDDRCVEAIPTEIKVGLLGRVPVAHTAGVS